MESAAEFEQVVTRLRQDFPAVARGTIERIMIEEHDLLVGLQPGDIVPPIVVDATIERLERLRGAVGADEAELA